MGLAIWLVLILAFAVPKANRNIRVLLILAPLVVVKCLWSAFIQHANANSTDALEFGLIFNSMAVGVTVLWLTANSLARFKGVIRFLLSFVMLVIVAGFGPLSYYTDFSEEMVLFLALFVFMALTMLVALTLSRKLCKGKYRPVCFTLWLAFWTLLGSVLAMGGFFIVGSIIFSPPSFSEAILMLLLAGSIFGLFLYALNLPYLILGFAHPFFRRRLCASLSLKPKTPIAKSNMGSNGGENVI